MCDHDAPVFSTQLGLKHRRQLLRQICKHSSNISDYLTLIAQLYIALFSALWHTDHVTQRIRSVDVIFQPGRFCLASKPARLGNGLGTINCRDQYNIEL